MAKHLQNYLIGKEIENFYNYRPNKVRGEVGINLLTH